MTRKTSFTIEGRGRAPSHFPFSILHFTFVRAVFTENLTGAKFTNEVALTVFKVRVWADQTAPENQATDRHKFGICEYIRYANEPVSSQLVWQANGKGGRFGEGAFYNPAFECPLDGCADPLAAEATGARYVPRIDVVEPKGVIARDVQVWTNGVPPNEAGGIGFTAKTYLIPMDVLFNHLDTMEVSCNEGTHEGYFAHPAFSNWWCHSVANGAGKWGKVDIHNFAGDDTAMISNILYRLDANGNFRSDHLCGWQNGELTWRVPIGWDRYDGRSEDELRPESDVPHATNVVLEQAFQIYRDGEVHVEKFGYMAIRTTNDVVNLINLQPDP